MMMILLTNVLSPFSASVLILLVSLGGLEIFMGLVRILINPDDCFDEREFDFSCDRFDVLKDI